MSILPIRSIVFATFAAILNGFAAIEASPDRLRTFATDCSGLQARQTPQKQKTLSRPGLPDRKYRIRTPSNYDATSFSKVVIVFHGWGGSGRSYTGGGWADYADTHNYIIVAPDGLSDRGRYNNAWTFPGSSDGIGQDGMNITTCDTNLQPTDYCYPSCAPCPSPCGWTHCLDDDFAFVNDLIADLSQHICVDSERIYVAGISNGGMFAWSLGQNSATAPLLAGIGSIIGLPHHDYNLGKGVDTTLPVIAVYGSNDLTVPPGDGSREFAETTDGEYYRYVDARHIHYTWAKDHNCLEYADISTVPPAYTYTIPGRSEVECKTYCEETDNSPPMSVDCRADMGHQSPDWSFDVVLKFFEDHAS